jgi:threonine/homoserine/homoserine lactone efflux protein
MSDVLMFMGALAVAYLVPGPDMILVLQVGTTWGRAHAFAAAIGLALARSCHVILAAAGLAALLQTAPWTFELVRLAGAAYLVWLGINSLRARTPVANRHPGNDGTGLSYVSALGRGLLTNLLNPKPLLFCSVLLPQFIHPEQGSIGGQFLRLGVMLVGLGLAFDAIYSGAGAALGQWLARHPVIHIVQRCTFASALVGLGARLALMQSPR